MQKSSPILARQWWRHFRLSFSLCISLSLSLSLSPNVPHAQYRKRFRASYNNVFLARASGGLFFGGGGGAWSPVAQWLHRNWTQLSWLKRRCRLLYRTTRKDRFVSDWTNIDDEESFQMFTNAKKIIAMPAGLTIRHWITYSYPIWIIAIYLYCAWGTFGEREREREIQRDRERERERERDGSDVIIVALKLAMNLHFHLPKIRTIGDEFTLSLAKNSHFSFLPSHFPSLPSRRGHHCGAEIPNKFTLSVAKIFSPSFFFQMARAARRVIENPRQTIKSCPVLYCSSHRKNESN